MNTSKLDGRNVCFTRGGKQGELVVEALREFGANTYLIPLIAFRKHKDALEKRIVERIHAFDWIILTSKNAVHYFFSQLHKQRIKLTAKIAVIGKKTKQAVEALGHSVAFIPTSYSSKDFVAEFREEVTVPGRILQPKGSLADSFIAHSLETIGHTVEEWIVYETYLPEESEPALVNTLKHTHVDAFFFTSPSAFAHFYDIIERNMLIESIEHAEFYSIGPTTSACMQAKGIHAKMPEQYTIKRMVELFIHQAGRKQQ